jgi:CheY-like chemotaxis protein
VGNRHIRVVLVEEDEVLQHRLASAITRSMPDVEVRGTPDADEALQLLVDDRSRLLITQGRTRGGDGVMLVTQARRQRPALAVIVMSDGLPEAHAWRDRISRMGAAALVEKPPQLENFLGLVGRMLGPAHGFSGEVVLEGLPDLVQMLCLSHASGVLRIQHDNEPGMIWFDNGEIVHATALGKRGVEAFQVMCNWEAGAFNVDREARAAERTIEVPAIHLLLECTRLNDEERAARPAEADVFGAQRKDLETPGQRAAEYFQRGLELVREGRHADAIREWEEAATLDPQNRTYQSNLRRLRERIRRSDDP